MSSPATDESIDPSAVPSVRTILHLSVSALAVLVAEPLYLMEDLAVVGRLGAVALAALGVGSLILGVVSTQLTFLSYGTTARSSRLFGRGDRTGAVAEGIAASWIAVVVGLVIVGVMQVIAPWVVGVIAPSGGVSGEATGWVRIAVCGVPLILLSMAGNGWMRGVQDTRRPVVYVAVGLGVSAVICPLLVHGLLGFPDMGLHGSAVANLVGQSISGLLFAQRLLAERSSTGLRPRWATIRAQLALARDLIVRSLSFQVCFLSAAAVAARFGVASLAAHQLVLQLWNFVSLLLDSLAIAAQSLVGAALGAKAIPGAIGVARRVTVLSVAASLGLVALFAAGQPVLARIFTDDRDVLDAVVTPWWFFVAMLPVAGVVFALDGVLLGGGDAAYLRTTTVVCALVGFLPMIWASLAFDWGLAGIWTGLCLFMLFRLVALVARMSTGRWTAIELR
ncbi:MATE family efflux transporter [Williamsia phyllosphaerae]|uniref:DNA-damage-inducible protein DinF n=1 Tax=Williamsia phyllosphaerae TaxID=885042 RepID=A0ABQ1V868_9NOCA|nr:MATE family efflux transporter [Williamsia phyllosphaerae]GGF40121.1 DNA-damage-inducible protein DinF [Williamsia phyllosphaerae]